MGSRLVPWRFFTVTILVIVDSAFRFRQTAKEIHWLGLGRDGERPVAEQLTMEAD